MSTMTETRPTYTTEPPPQVDARRRILTNAALADADAATAALSALMGEVERLSALADSGDIAVLRVKLADNEDNRDPARVAALPGAAERVATRYEPARALLEDGLARAMARRR